LNAAIKASVALAVLVGLMTVVIALSGLHTNPVVGGAVSISLAILLNIAVVFWALKQTASENSYGLQLTNGVIIGIFGGFLVFAVSWLLLTLVFPDYLEQMRVGYIEWMEASGMPRTQVDEQRELLGQATPMSQSLPGWVGTFFTSLIAAAITAIFQRRK